MWEASKWVTAYYIWKNRNNKLFKANPWVCQCWYRKFKTDVTIGCRKDKKKFLLNGISG